MIALGLLVLLAAGGLAVSGITTRDDSAHSPARSGLLGYHLSGPGSRLFFFGLVLAAAAMSGLARMVAGRFGGTNRTLWSRTPLGPHRDENRTGRDNT